jgi:hypothetical protein
MGLNLARARGDSFFALLGLDEFEDASLPLGQHDLIIRKILGGASSNEQFFCSRRPVGDAGDLLRSLSRFAQRSGYSWAS